MYQPKQTLTGAPPAATNPNSSSASLNAIAEHKRRVEMAMAARANGGFNNNNTAASSQLPQLVAGSQIPNGSQAFVGSQRLQQATQAFGQATSADTSAQQIRDRMAQVVNNPQYDTMPTSFATPGVLRAEALANSNSPSFATVRGTGRGGGASSAPASSNTSQSAQMSKLFAPTNTNNNNNINANAANVGSARQAIQQDIAATNAATQAASVEMNARIESIKKAASKFASTQAAKAIADTTSSASAATDASASGFDFKDPAAQQQVIQLLNQLTSSDTVKALQEAKAHMGDLALTFAPVQEIISGVNNFTQNMTSYQSDDHLPTGKVVGYPWSTMMPLDMYHWMCQEYVNNCWSNSLRTRLLWSSQLDSTWGRIGATTNNVSDLANSVMFNAVPFLCSSLVVDSARRRLLLAGSRMIPAASAESSSTYKATTGTTSAPKKVANLWEPFVLSYPLLDLSFDNPATSLRNDLWPATGDTTEDNTFVPVADVVGVASRANRLTVLDSQTWVGTQTMDMVCATVSTAAMRLADFVVDVDGDGSSFALINTVENKQKREPSQTFVVRLLPNGALNKQFDSSYYLKQQSGEVDENGKTITTNNKSTNNSTNVLGVKFRWCSKKGIGLLLVQRDNNGGQNTSEYGASVNVIDKTGVSLRQMLLGGFGSDLVVSADEQTVWVVGQQLVPNAPNGDFQTLARVVCLQLQLHPVSKTWELVPVADFGAGGQVMLPLMNTPDSKHHHNGSESEADVSTMATNVHLSADGHVWIVGHGVGRRGTDATEPVVWILDGATGTIKQFVALFKRATKSVTVRHSTLRLSDDQSVYELVMAGQLRSHPGHAEGTQGILMTSRIEVKSLVNAAKRLNNNNNKAQKSFQLADNTTIHRLPGVTSDWPCELSCVAVDANSDVAYSAGTMQIQKTAWSRQAFVSVTPLS